MIERLLPVQVSGRTMIRCLNDRTHSYSSITFFKFKKSRNVTSMTLCFAERLVGSGCLDVFKLFAGKHGEDTTRDCEPRKLLVLLNFTNSPCGSPKSLNSDQKDPHFGRVISKGFNADHIFAPLETKAHQAQLASVGVLEAIIRIETATFEIQIGPKTC